VPLKRRLEGVLQELLAPIRERRAQFATDVADVVALVREGTDQTRWTAADVVRDVRTVFALGDGRERDAFSALERVAG
jgi:tryptophanyl-tRNA synthetase